MLRSPSTPALVLSACLALPTGALAALNEGEVRVGGRLEAESTLLASEVLSLNLSNSTGSAIISGDMERFSLNTHAWMSETVSNAAASSAAVDFCDTITLDIPGLPSGTPVKVRIAWWVDAGATSHGDSEVITSARAILQGPNKQMWERESNNQGDPETWNPSGRVEFDFIVRTSTPEDGNIKLTAAIDSVAYLDSEHIPTKYEANPASNLRLEFEEVVSVQTTSGLDLPIWTIESTSLFDYGEGDGPVTPSNPSLKISPSASGPGFIKLSWPSLPYESYTIESTADFATWSDETQVQGTGLPLALDLPKNGSQRFYRITSQIGTVGGG